MMRKFYRWKEKRRFNKAKEKAIFLNELSGKKHLVIKLSGIYHIFNREDLKLMKRKRKFRKLTWFEIESKAMYVANKRNSTVNQ